MRHFRLEYILLYLHRISVFTQNLGQTQDIPAELPSEESGFERIHADLIFHQQIRSLPPEQQEVLLLRFGQELTLRQIAQVTGVPLRTVQSRLRAALKKLKSQLEKEEHCDK